MKFTLALLATAFALVTQTAAVPQGGLPIFVCDISIGTTCPNGLHCCPPQHGTEGLCVKPGANCPDHTTG